MSICLVCDFSIGATCPSIQLPALLFVCVLFVLFLLFLLVFYEPNKKQGRRLVDRKLVETPSNFIAGRPKAAFCFGSLVVLDVVYR